ncbi:MAG TPA: hypothetical protein VKS99_12925 [Blastocatellia bacterium]|nr:hypothetical protein [Blastocatellia bacterium]
MLRKLVTIAGLGAAAFILPLISETRYTVKAHGSNRDFFGGSSHAPRYDDSIVTDSMSQYGPDTCKQGYVWREAHPDDHVCVTPQTRSRTAQDNRQAASRRNPKGGPYGPDTCKQGYVWREAFPRDHVCVLPETRAQAAKDNRLAASRRAGSRID